MIHELGDQLLPVFAIGCGLLFLVIWVVAATIDSLYKTSRNAKLKERLIDRGYSAAEIAWIVGLKPTNINDVDENRPVPPVKPANGFHGHQRVS